MPTEPSVAALADLLTVGRARVPAAWELKGPGDCGLWWRADASEVVATPRLLRLAARFPRQEEALAALLATEARYREPWLELQAARLVAQGQRKAEAELLEAVEALGPASATIRGRLERARLRSTPFSGLELALLGATADQALAAPALLRVLGGTAHLVEGEKGAPADILPAVSPLDPSQNWISGRLLQAPSSAPGEAGRHVLRGAVAPCGEDRMAWVLGSPWITFLAVLAFTAEAWSAERQGGVQIELPLAQVTHFAAPHRLDVVVTLVDGREVLCGSLGELCLRVLDALGMAMVPFQGADALDKALAGVIGELLRARVWIWQSVARPRYVISDDFSIDCYRGRGHRHIFRGADHLSQVMRSVCVSWAHARAGDPT